MLTITAALLFSYLLGSIPTAYIFVKALKGIDIRSVGSGNVGATNAMRVLGKKLGILILFLDIFKGFAAVVFLADLFSARPLAFSDQNLRLLMGLACICGHTWTVFLQFKGGKGIATSFGVLIGLSLRIPGLNLVLAGLVLTWFLTFFIFRMVSLSSICSAAVLPVLSFLLKLPPVFIIASFGLSIFVIYRHKANLSRIMKGKEPRLYFKK